MPQKNQTPFFLLVIVVIIQIGLGLGCLSSLQALPMFLERGAHEEKKLDSSDTGGNQTAEQKRRLETSEENLPAEKEENRPAVPALTLPLETFESALQANPEAARFVVKQITQNNILLLPEEANPTRSGAVRSENIQAVAAFKKALQAEYPWIDVSDLFPINQLGKISAYPALSAEMIRDVLVSIESSTAEGLLNEEIGKESLCQTIDSQKTASIDQYWTAFQEAWNKDWKEALDDSDKAKKRAVAETEKRKKEEAKFAIRDPENTLSATIRDGAEQATQIAAAIPEPHVQTFIVPGLSLIAIGADTVNKVFNYLAGRRVQCAQQVEEKAIEEVILAEDQLYYIQSETLSKREQAQHQEKTLYHEEEMRVIALAKKIFDLASKKLQDWQSAFDLSKRIWLQRMSKVEALLDQVKQEDQPKIQGLQQKWQKATEEANQIKIEIGKIEQNILVLEEQYSDVKNQLKKTNEELNSLQKGSCSKEELQSKTNIATQLQTSVTCLESELESNQYKLQGNQKTFDLLQKEALKATRKYLNEEGTPSRKIARVQVSFDAYHKALKEIWPEPVDPPEILEEVLERMGKALLLKGKIEDSDIFALEPSIKRKEEPSIDVTLFTKQDHNRLDTWRAYDRIFQETEQAREALQGRNRSGSTASVESATYERCAENLVALQSKWLQLAGLTVNSTEQEKDMQSQQDKIHFLAREQFRKKNRLAARATADSLQQKKDDTGFSQANKKWKELAEIEDTVQEAASTGEGAYYSAIKALKKSDREEIQKAVALKHQLAIKDFLINAEDRAWRKLTPKERENYNKTVYEANAARISSFEDDLQAIKNRIKSSQEKLNQLWIFSSTTSEKEAIANARQELKEEIISQKEREKAIQWARWKDISVEARKERWATKEKWYSKKERDELWETLTSQEKKQESLDLWSKTESIMNDLSSIDAQIKGKKMIDRVALFDAAIQKQPEMEKMMDLTTEAYEKTLNEPSVTNKTWWKICLVGTKYSKPKCVGQIFYIKAIRAMVLAHLAIDDVPDARRNRVIPNKITSHELKEKDLRCYTKAFDSLEQARKAYEDAISFLEECKKLVPSTFENLDLGTQGHLINFKKWLEKLIQFTDRMPALHSKLSLKLQERA